MRQALVVTCLRCGCWAETDNTAAPHEALTCPPGSACCQEDHDHAAAADSCTSAHEGHDCPDPATCGSFPDVDGCPGGHHGYGVTDCTVCKPLIIAAWADLSGTATG